MGWIDEARMVRRRGGIAMLAALGLMLQGCSREPSPSPKQASGSAKAMKVSIVVNGGRSNAVTGDETEADCARFQLSADQVNQFFVRGKPVEEKAYAQNLANSPCFASGTIDLAGGQKASWVIDQARRGVVVGPDGTHKYLLCTACSSPPFREGPGES